jgi:antibiotic biosynthesis monooxygenase (ABM) superfamily enzyme
MILFQLYFEVADQKRAEFEKAFVEIFEPALRLQKGLQEVKFLRLYPPALVAEIQAAPTEFNYQVNFVFDSEENRRHWATSPDHDVAWPKVSSLARQAAWRGYDLISPDRPASA